MGYNIYEFKFEFGLAKILPRFKKYFLTNQEICRIIRIPELIQKDWSIMKSGSRYSIHNAVESTLNHSNGVNQGVQIA